MESQTENRLYKENVSFVGGWESWRGDIFPEAGCLVLVLASSVLATFVLSFSLGFVLPYFFP